MQNEQQNPGALLDLRPETAKERDYRFEEIVVSADPVNWVEKPRNTWRKFPIFNQDGSGSCVAQTLRKQIGVYIWLNTGVFVDVSASHIYQRRSNKPASGMAGVDAFQIGQKGVTLEQFAKSEGMNDTQMDAVKILPFMEEVGKVFKLGNYLTVPIKDIDTIASIIQNTGKAVMVWFYFQGNEWTDTPAVQNPNLDLAAISTLRHSVAAVDFTLFNGKKALVIDESWGLGATIDGQRVITEDFFKARNWFAGHFLNFAFETTPSPTKPTYTFSKTLRFTTELSTDQDVVALQNILKYEGLFPANTDSSGYYGAITAKAVLAFQMKYQVASNEELQTIGGKIVGPKTIKKLNELYGA